MVFKLFLVTWACLWGSAPGNGAFHALRDHVSPKVSHGHHQDRTPFNNVNNIDMVKDENELVYFLGLRWPSKIVPVAIKHTFKPQYKPWIYRAMDLLNTLTCLRFRNVTNPKKEYHIQITDHEEGCFANIGFAGFEGGEYLRDGFQSLNLDPGCYYAFGVVVHEFIHAVGVNHQQVRSDRNDYVKIHNDNITIYGLSNFDHKNETYDYLHTMGLPYDYNSLMHYPFNAFAKDEKHSLTIELKKPFPGYLGQREGPSRTDIAMINRYYECWNHYLGDDITNAVPYEEFHSRYIKPKVILHKTDRGKPVSGKPASDSLIKWVNYMRSMTKP